jgi:hypothetical protein
MMRIEILGWVDVSGALEVDHSREELEARSSCSLCERGRPSRRLCERGRHCLQAPRRQWAVRFGRTVSAFSILSQKRSEREVETVFSPVS